MDKSFFKELLSLISPEPSGRSVYRTVWQLANEHIFDVEKLVQWKRWKYRFYSQIRSHEDAIRYANQALASLGDRYNQVYSQEQDRELFALIHNPYAVTEKELPDNIGYFRLQNFLPWNTADQVYRALCVLRQCRALVFDLRGNGGGDLEQAINCLGLFLEEGPLVTFKTRVPKGGYSTRSLSLTKDSLLALESYPAKAATGEKTTLNSIPSPSPGRAESRTLRRSYALGQKPLVLLVDKNTASAAEMFVCALQANGIAVVGSRTCGKGIGQLHFSLKEKLGLKGQEIALQLTNCRYYSPGGMWLGDAGQTVASGITPDFVVPANQEDCELTSAQDNQLQAAIDLLASHAVVSKTINCAQSL